MHTANELIAFVHIEKAAGTTLNHILRCNFLLRHIDVRPLSASSNKNFLNSDLNTIFRINPFVKSISGHSIKPYVGLEKRYPKIKYITLLRDPIKRYMSNYIYWREELKKNITFEQFLNKSDLKNFQTKKICGDDNLEKAKKILSKRFFLVGIVEEFNTFLILLQNKLKPIVFDPRYIRQNVSQEDSPIKKQLPDLMEKFHDRIVENNKLDIRLYEFVKNELYFKECENYGSQLKEEISYLNDKLSFYRWHVQRSIDYTYRKFYLDPVTGIIRKTNHLPFKGSY